MFIILYESKNGLTVLKEYGREPVEVKEDVYVWGPKLFESENDAMKFILTEKMEKCNIVRFM